MPPPISAMMKSGPWSTISDVVTEGDKVSFTWKVGRLKQCSFGDQVAGKSVRAGGGEWKMVFFPKGFTDADYASVYCTSVSCELDEGDPNNPDKITSRAFASVKVTMTPEPMEFKEKKKGDGDGEDDDDDDDDGAESIASSVAPPSTVASKQSGASKRSKAVSGKTGRSSVRGPGTNAGGSVAGSSAGGGDAAQAPIVVEPIVRELSQLFTNKDSSWGFEKMFDMGKLYNPREGYMTQFGTKPEDVQMGEITMVVEIFAASGIRTDDPEKDVDLTEKGRQRTSWTLHNIQRLTEKIGPDKRLSSSEFNCDGDWYFDIFPSGFQVEPSKDPKDSWISLYLHSTRRQVELGDVIKTWFRLGVKKANPDEADTMRSNFDPVWFPKGSSCVSVFTPKTKCYGKQKFIQIRDLIEGPERGGARTNARELIIGNYENGGSVTFVLDLLVTDDINGEVQHMLHEVETFGKVHSHCTETDMPLSVGWLPGGGKWLPGGGSWMPGVSGKVLCYHCGKPFSKEVTNYQARMEEYGYEIGREYIMDILMREEEHALDGVLKKLNPQDKLDQAVKSVSSFVTSLRITPAKEAEVEDAEAEALAAGAEPEEKEESRAEEDKRKKEEALLKAFEAKIKEHRGEIEDAHFSKPVCSKCAEKRKMLQNLPYIFANFRPLTMEERAAMKAEGREPKPAFTFADQNEIEDLDEDQKEKFKIVDVPNFRLGWKNILEGHQQKLDEMYSAMAKVTIDNGSPAVMHANDEWIKKRLGDGVDPATRPGRNAMTLTRGCFYVEPLETAKQCSGMVNGDGIPPWEDEDAPRGHYCDVRFDVRPDPNKPVKVHHCLYTGKVFCSFCCHEKHKTPLPMFEADPTKAEPVTVCFGAKEFLSHIPAPRITPVSKKEEPEPPVRRRGVVEEDEEEESALEKLEEQLRSFPFCGPQVADTLFPGDV